MGWGVGVLFYMSSFCFVYSCFLFFLARLGGWDRVGGIKLYTVGTIFLVFDCIKVLLYIYIYMDFWGLS